MDSTPIFVAVVIVMPAVGLVSWASLCMAQVEKDFRAFSAFGGLRDCCWLTE